MDLSAFYLDTWRKLSDDDCITSCKALLEQLPDEWLFTGLETYQADKVINSIACFEYQGAKFSLVLGAENVMLGFDLSSISMVSTVRKLNRLWNQFAEPYLDEVDTEAEIAEAIQLLSDKRIVTIQPFLCEVRAIENNSCKPFEDLLYPVASVGLQLPTPNEWEYACAGSVRALFRWGDDAPVLQSPQAVGDYPEDESYLITHPHKDILLPVFEKMNGWNSHKKPNGFGIYMPHNPYHWELTSEKGIMRGGDGGSSICGAEGYFKAWLALSTFYEHDWRTSYEKYGFVCGAYVRRILRLSDFDGCVM